MAKKKIEVNLEGFRKKMQLLSTLSNNVNDFMEDSAEFIRNKLVDEQLNAAGENAAWAGLPRRILRRQSGQLGRSYAGKPKIKKVGKSIVRIRLQHKKGKAPYGTNVFQKAKNRTGKIPTAWTKFYYQKTVKTAWRKSVKSWVKDINDKKKVRYFRPEEYK